MKALSLWQPWGNFVALGQKSIETRSWPTKHRGPLAICAAKKTDPEAMKAFGYPDHKPLGVLLCVAELVDCRPLREEELERAMCHVHLRSIEGRFAWVLENVRRTYPQKIVGRQGLFELPDVMIKAALASGPSGLQPIWPVTDDRIEYEKT